MGILFQPSLNFWEGTGVRILAKGKSAPSNALNYSSLLLYVHGYNNDEEDASASYNRFEQLQNKLGGLSANVLGVFWPGENWIGALFYMKAISHSQQVGANLARQLHSQAKARGYLKLDFIAHSLGNRLVLETISALNDLLKVDPVPIVFGQFALMAAAVPVRYLTANKSLFEAVNSFSSSLNLYSQSDRILQFAFPAGQTAAGDGFFPVALGRRFWAAASLSVPGMRQVNNTNYGHSDYWGGRGNNVNESAAKKVRDFMPHIGKPISRTIPSLSNLYRSPESRKTAKARVVAARHL